MKKRYSANIQHFVSSIVDHLPKGMPSEGKEFVKQFFGQTSLVELEAMNKKEAAAVAADAFSFFRTRALDESNIRIFEPNESEHGYHSYRLMIQLINDDKPFLVDSLTNEITRLGFTVHTVFHPLFNVQRGKKGELNTLLDNEHDANGPRESLIHFELSGLPEDIDKAHLKAQLEEVIQYIQHATADWKTMLDKTEAAKAKLIDAKRYNAQDIEEAQAFLDWLMHKNFVFLGYAGIDFSGNESNPEGAVDKKSLLGISKVDDIPAEINVAPCLVDTRKASRYSKVHRRALMDVVTVKRINDAGEVVGEHRFYGLFTSNAYHQNATHIPLVAKKIERLLDAASFPPQSHSGKALVAILQAMPRDELLQVNDEELFDLSMGVLALEGHPGVKLFARMDVGRRYISTIVYVPRELFSTSVRLQITHTLEKHFGASEESYETSIGESPLARLHLMLRTSDNTPETLDIESIEKEIATAIMLWSDKLHEALFEHCNDDQHAERLFRTYAHAFNPAYTSRYPILSTIYDIEKMEACLEHKNLEIALYHERKSKGKTLHVKIYNIEEHIALSDILPKLEHMGLYVLDEFPYVVKPTDKPCLRLRDIRMELSHVEDVSLAQVTPNFEELLRKVWHGEIEDDLINALVFTCGLNVQQIEMLRACFKYLRQIGFNYDRQIFGKTLIAHPALTLLLVQLFEARFDPNEKDRDSKTSMLSSQIEQGLEHVESLAEDRIIGTMHKLIMAILRTNYYIRGNEDASSVLSFKINSGEVPNIPLPKPHVEIFIYSARVEGVHLRGGKVARGGLRWSDRHDDFRTEILGLMKAQVVKNAVIVPVGSKGGFVVKQVTMADREAFMAEGIECYKEYLRGMLDITDNVIKGNIVPPSNVVRHDEDDPYLVVAADKGTATFSDTANGVSQEYGFWLDDAFASGGSVGYDHKKMGITARGAWVSVERHFAEMGHNMDTTPFTVAGVGDMSGDVFGNGMLLSENIKLVAAFNHLHIFLDPDPDPAKSFVERQRMFELPRSNWADYDKKLISKGGAIFDRSAKEVKLTKEIQAILDTDKKSCSPDELVNIILKSPVDLLWNGGIGTYVKSTDETHDDAGDRANDSVRVNGNEIRAKIIGEGGNLGLTQQGRIEYAKSGGRINTDAIDNSAGVDCSDHEVNIKIGLQKALSENKLTLEKRNQVLESMTDEVGELVLRDNQLQTQAISIEEQFSVERLPAHIQLMRTLESRGLLDRAIEFLPNEPELAELLERGQGLTRPEISVLLAYSKIALFDDVINSTMPDEPYFAVDLKRYFPEAMRTGFDDQIQSHSLRREIISTVATNSMVNRAGISFYFDILQDTRLPARDIVAAYSVARDLLGLRDIWADIEAQEQAIGTELCATIFDSISESLKYMTFWLLRHQVLPLNVDKVMETFCAATQETIKNFGNMLTEAQLEPLEEHKKDLIEKGLSDDLARNFTIISKLNGLLDICSIASKCNQSTDIVGNVYFALAEQIQFFDITAKASEINTDNRWDRVALQSLVHEFHDELARLTSHVFEQHKGDVSAFSEASAEVIGRMSAVMEDMLERDALSSPMLMVALQQLKQVGH